MTTLFHDVHEKTEANMAGNRPTGATCDEVMYADDTICITPDTKTMNAVIHKIEEAGKSGGGDKDIKKVVVTFF